MNLTVDLLYNSVQGDQLLKTLKFRFDQKHLIALKKELFGIFYWVIISTFDNIVKRAVLKKISVNDFLMKCVKVLPECQDDIIGYVKYKPTLKKDWRFIQKIDTLTSKQKRTISTLLSIQDWQRFAMCCGYSFWDVRNWKSETELIKRVEVDNKELFDIYFVAKGMGLCTLFRYLEQVSEQSIKR